MGPYICKLPTNPPINDYVDDGHGRYLGECVSLLKRMCLSIPVKAQWNKGDPVKGNSKLATGTAIASFDPKTFKFWHGAIYVRQDANGIWVWDQFNTGPYRHPPKLNLLKWNNVAHPHVAANNFCVIK